MRKEPTLPTLGVGKLRGKQLWMARSGSERRDGTGRRETRMPIWSEGGGTAHPPITNSKATTYVRPVLCSFGSFGFLPAAPFEGADQSSHDFQVFFGQELRGVHYGPSMARCSRLFLRGGRATIQEVTQGNLEMAGDLVERRERWDRLSALEVGDGLDTLAQEFGELCLRQPPRLSVLFNLAPDALPQVRRHGPDCAGAGRACLLV